MPSAKTAEAAPAGALYVETSAVLRAVLESGVSPDVEARLGSARVCITSRLSIVESARALHRLRREGAVSETALADAARDLDRLWARCDVWEITREVCALAANVAPAHPLLSPDGIHLATFLTARRRLGDVVLLTADRRLEAAAAVT